MLMLFNFELMFASVVNIAVKSWWKLWRVPGSC